MIGHFHQSHEVEFILIEELNMNHFALLITSNVTNTIWMHTTAVNSAAEYSL